MVTDKQVLRLRKYRARGHSQEAAAAAAAMSVRTARKWEKTNLLPSEIKTRPRHWRTRPDPFEGVWEKKIVPLLRDDEAGILEATTLLETLKETDPERFNDSQLRTLQRRIRDWKAFNGPSKEVFFPQEHPPGREGQIDFTHCTELNVTIGGQPFKHLIFQFILSCSGHRHCELAISETFEALSSGIQNSVWEFGGTPEFWRTDNLSAGTHQLNGEAGRVLTERYAELLDFYGVKSTRIFPGNSNENGVVEKGNDLLKKALNQALFLRGSRDFRTVEDYWKFVLRIVAKLNERKREGFEVERKHLKALPSAPMPAYTDLARKVSKNSCIRVWKQTYSVPSKLIGYQVTVRLHPSFIEVFYRGRLVEKFPRLRGNGARRIDYRHISHSLVRKPGAFARYKFREELFPSLVFRRAYDALAGWRGGRADVDYVRILHLAARTMERDVETALQVLLEASDRFDYGDVQALVKPTEQPRASLVLPMVPDLKPFDDLLTGECYDELSNQKPQEEQWSAVACVG